MQLLSQVAGALLAGVLLVAVARQFVARRQQTIALVAIVPVVVAGLLAIPALRDATASLLDQRNANAALSSDEAQLQGGIGLGVDVEFLGWAGHRFATGETFDLVVGGTADEPSVRQWALFQLAPHIAVEAANEADWFVFYDSRPGSSKRRALEDLEIYSPRFAIARNKLAR